MLEFAVVIASVAAGAIASVSGFGIGSVLTPVFATMVPTKAAVAIVSIPHFIGTALRFAMIREHLNRRVLCSFGITSAAGGLIGALLHERLQSTVLGYIFAALLIFAGIMGVTGLAQRVRLRDAGAWIAGALSGWFGGLVGNQGGIRSAALLGFDVSRESFVATATAIALLVDLFRIPVYLAVEHHRMFSVPLALLVAIGGVIGGTILGKPLLLRIPQAAYRTIVSLIILALGIWMLGHPA